MDKKIENDAGYLWVFDYDNAEFERVRELCLADTNNKLRENYTKEKLKISDHIFFAIQYGFDNEPIAMCGVKEYTPDVCRIFNRWYLFPKSRGPWSKREELISALRFMNGSMRELFKLKYKLYFISMQQRNSKRAGKQLWWKAFTTMIYSLNKRWKSYDDGLVQVHEGNLASCYQNIIYMTIDNYTFEDWNPKIMSYDKHALRMNYEASLRNTT